MKRNFLLQILALSGLLAVSCREVAIDSEYPEGNGQYLSIMVDTPDIRTRAVDLNPGAALYLKNIWVGIYDRSTGKRVGGTLTNGVELDRFLTASGNTLVDLVKIEIENNIEANANDRYCVVGVANYDGIDAYDVSGQSTKLYDLLKKADKWEDFIGIAIDTDESQFENQVPLLVGYLHKESVSPANIKVDQFSTSKQSVKLSNYSLDDDVYVRPVLTQNWLTTYFGGINTKFQGQNYVLKLRRLRSKINVVIETPVSGVTVTNLQYKICNAPASAYLVQRRTNSFGSDMGTEVAFSPNSADVLTDVGDNGYFETEYMSPQVNTNFSFEHFENLHWARYTEGLKEYHDREKKEDNDAFSALATSPEDWNNRATYFVLKMNIRDDNLGRNAEVEYTIHEGFCNDENGNSLVNDAGDGDLSQRLLDFACVRNTDYYYKITINSIKDIFVQVTDSNQHTTDQQGKIWDIDYVVDQKSGSGDPEPYESGEEIVVDEGLVLKTTDDDFDNAKDIAFRFVGTYYDTDRAVEVPVDICYNFKRGDLDGFAGLWNAPTNESSEYIVATGEGDEYRSAYQALTEFCSGSSDNAANFNRMIDEIQVKYDGEYCNIKDYLEKVTGDDNPNPNIEGFKFSGLKYYEVYDEANDNRRNHLRGLYIFDVQKAVVGGTRVQADNDACTWLYKINGIEQLPLYLESEEYEMIHVTTKGRPVEAETDQLYTDFSDKHGGKGMLLSEYPDLAFRILGYYPDTDPNTKTTTYKYFDLLYNLSQTEYTDYTDKDEWPDMNLNGLYTKTVAKGSLDAGTIPQSLLDGLKVIVNEKDEYDIYSFVTGYERGVIRLSAEDKLGFHVSPYRETIRTSTPEKYVRALYLLDRKSKFVKPALLAENEKSATFQAYAVEQYPHTTGQAPLTLPNLNSNYYTSTNKVNFLDPNLDLITIPGIQGVDPSAYKYKIIVKTRTGGKTGECLVNVAPDGDGNYKFYIPMKAIPGNDCLIYLKAISSNDQYKDSEEKQIGTVKLDNTIPSTAWDFSTTTWGSRFKKWTNYNSSGAAVKSDKQKYPYYKLQDGTTTYDYLDLYNNGKDFRGYVNGNNGVCISLNNSGSALSVNFRVYKNCIVTVKATTAKESAGGELAVVGGAPSSHTMTGYEKTAGTFVSKIELGENDSEYISIRAGSSNGANIFSITVTEL